MENKRNNNKSKKNQEETKNVKKQKSKEREESKATTKIVEDFNKELDTLRIQFAEAKASIPSAAGAAAGVAAP